MAFEKIILSINPPPVVNKYIGNSPRNKDFLGWLKKLKPEINKLLKNISSDVFRSS